MKAFFILPFLGSAMLLPGCAGVNGDFECDATTSDRCMTMEQANQKARQKSGVALRKPIESEQPGRSSLPQTYAPLPAPEVMTPRSAVFKKRAPFVPGNARNTSHTTQLPTPVSAASAGVAVPVCSPVRCDSAGQVNAKRSAEKIAYIWVAPWVDSDDVFHQPGRVSFVTERAGWRLPQTVN